MAGFLLRIELRRVLEVNKKSMVTFRLFVKIF